MSRIVNANHSQLDYQYDLGISNDNDYYLDNENHYLLRYLVGGVRNVCIFGYICGISHT